MSDAGPVAGVSQLNIAPASAPAELSESQFAEGLEGLLDERPKRQRQAQASDPPAEEQGDTPSDPKPGPEDPATSEPAEEEGDYEPDTEPVEEGEEPGHQSVEPPNGWNANDKEVFRALPPEAQAVILRRDSEQNKAFVTKTQEIADTRKALETAVQETYQASEAYGRNLQQLLWVAAPELQKFANVDWQQLAQDQPAEYVRLTAERDAARQRIGGIQQEMQRVAAYAQEQQAQQFNAIRQQEWQKLVEALPAFGDRETGPKAQAEMRQWLTGYGFSAQEISQVVDHRVIRVVDIAMKAERAAQARQKAQEKRVAPASPTAQPPGSPRQRGDSAAAQRRGQKMAALRQSGSEKDAISYLMEVL